MENKKQYNADSGNQTHSAEIENCLTEFIYYTDLSSIFTLAL